MTNKPSRPELVKNSDKTMTTATTYGPCLLQIGDTIPLVPSLEWIATSARYIAATNSTVVTAALEDAAGRRLADRVTTIHHGDDADESERGGDVDAHIAELNAEQA